MDDVALGGSRATSSWLRFLAWRSTDRGRVSLVIALPLVAYLVLVLLGVTTSSIGADSLRQDPSAPLGLQIGQSQGIRSDEFGTESPIWLGQSARSGEAAVTPLSVSNDFFAQIPDGPISAVVFFDGSTLALSPWIAETVLFAAKWWLPTLMLFIGLPLWFRQMTGKLRWGYLASALIALAPASMWWSGRPVNTIGFVAAGCALAVAGAHRLVRNGWKPRVTGIVMIVGAGILLARTPTYYQPLAIVVGIPIVLATAAYLFFWRVSWPKRLVAMGAIALSGIVWTGLLFWENRDAVAAGLATVYPGSRQSSGSLVPAGQVFGATNLAWLESLSSTATLNESELSSSFTVLILVVGVLLLGWGRRAVVVPSGYGARLPVAFFPMAVCTVFWLAWTLFDWGTFGSLLPLINRVPSTRAAESVGFLATLSFCLAMSVWRTPRRILVPAIAAALTGIVSAYGGISLRHGVLPGLTVPMIIVSAVVAAAVVFVLVRWPERLWAIGVAVVAACALTATAVPILFGLGDLRASATAQDFLGWGSQAREQGTVWASDSLDIDSLMTATGTPALSGRQQIGPDEAQWLRLDPGGIHQDMWNRGGLHIEFIWSDALGVSFTLPSPDAIVVTGSPCTIADRMPELRHIISSHPVAGACLTEAKHITWSGRQAIVYDIGG